MDSEKTYRVGIFKGVGDLSFSGSATLTPGSVVTSGSGSGGSSSTAAQDACAANCMLQAGAPFTGDLTGKLATCKASCAPAAPAANLLSRSNLSSMLMSVMSPPATTKVPTTRTASSYGAPATTTKVPATKQASSYGAPADTSAPPAVPAAAPVASSNTVYYVVGGLVVVGVAAYLLTRK